MKQRGAMTFDTSGDMSSDNSAAMSSDNSGDICPPITVVLFVLR